MTLNASIDPEGVLTLASAIPLYLLRDRLLLSDLGTNWLLIALAAVLACVSSWIAIKRRKFLTMGILAGAPELEASGKAGKLLTEGPLRQEPKSHWLVAVLLTACGSEADAPIPEAPGATAELFAPGTVSTALPEFATSFSPSGDTVFFNRTPADRSELTLFYAVQIDGQWEAAAPFEPTSEFPAIDPFFDPTTRRLYFSSDLGRGGNFDLWYLESADGGWSAPQALPNPINSDSSDIFNSVAADGTMVFSSTRDGPRDVYETRLMEGEWSTPQAVRFGEVDRSPGDGVGNPALSRDGRGCARFRQAPGRHLPDPDDRGDRHVPRGRRSVGVGSARHRFVGSVPRRSRFFGLGSATSPVRRPRRNHRQVSRRVRWSVRLESSLQ